jgi:hypothetical protein
VPRGEVIVFSSTVTTFFRRFYRSSETGLFLKFTDKKRVRQWKNCKVWLKFGVNLIGQSLKIAILSFKLKKEREPISPFYITAKKKVN